MLTLLLTLLTINLLNKATATFAAETQARAALQAAAADNDDITQPFLAADDDAPDEDAADHVVSDADATIDNVDAGPDVAHPPAGPTQHDSDVPRRAVSSDAPSRATSRSLSRSLSRPLSATSSKIERHIGWFSDTLDASSIDQYDAAAAVDVPPLIAGGIRSLSPASTLGLQQELEQPLLLDQHASKGLDDDDQPQVPLLHLGLLLFLSAWVVSVDTLKLRTLCGSALYWALVLSVAVPALGTLLLMRTRLLRQAHLNSLPGAILAPGVWTPSHACLPACLRPAAHLPDSLCACMLHASKQPVVLPRACPDCRRSLCSTLTNLPCLPARLQTRCTGPAAPRCCTRCCAAAQASWRDCLVWVGALSRARSCCTSGCPRM